MKSNIKRAIAVLLILTVALLTACSVTMDAVKAAEIGDSDVDLSNYCEYISNDELGELMSYGGYISKKEYSAMLSNNSVGASYYPSFHCFRINRTYTGGCVGVPENIMKFIMQHVKPGCKITIDSLEKMGGDLDK